MESTHDIFISYSRRDLAVVKAIKEELEASGFSCWMDLEGIESGSEEFADKIAQAIGGSEVVLFFLSEDSQTSRWSLNELRLARKEEKRIVLVRIGNAEMQPRFLLEFGGSDIIDWQDPAQRKKLRRDLGRWLFSKDGEKRPEDGKRDSVAAGRGWNPGAAAGRHGCTITIVFAVLAIAFAGSFVLLVPKAGQEMEVARHEAVWKTKGEPENALATVEVADSATQADIVEACTKAESDAPPRFWEEAVEEHVDAWKRKEESENALASKRVEVAAAVADGRYEWMARAASAPPSFPHRRTIVYVVQAGETLSQIASNFGVRVDVLARNNHIPLSGKVDVGQRLVIPLESDLADEDF